MNQSQPSRAVARILIVDDHPIVRQGYALLIGNQPDLEVCGSAATADEAMDEIRRTSPDLTVVDISLLESNGIELIKRIHEQHPAVKVLVVSAHDEHLFAERALNAGAMGYIHKQEATDRLVKGIQCVLADEIFVSDDIAGRMVQTGLRGRKYDGRSPVATLTNRELEVFELTGRGSNTRQIAEQLQLSPKTIERYKENIKHKLHISNSTELVQQATRWLLETGMNSG